jgi:hypothetical protein
VAVLFAPTSSGTKNAALSIPSNVSETPQIDVSLTGTGEMEPAWIDSIQIGDAQGAPRATYGKYDPVFITMHYVLTKQLKRRYKVVAKIAAFGQTAREVRKRVRAGRYTFSTSVLPGETELAANPVVCKLKVIRRRHAEATDTETRYVHVSQ